MANTALTHSTLEQISNLSQLHIVRQLAFMVIMAAAIALGIAAVLWARDADYSVLYMSLSQQDSVEIAAALDQNGVDYRINSASGLISVPQSRLEQVRLQLASQGLPRSTSIGYEILAEDQSLSTSNFMEQARFNRALEEELVNTIKFIRSVRDARVHLSIPRQSSFLRNSTSPSASVMLNLVEGQTPGSAQLSGIVHLVASSVAGLEPEKVSIVDQYGNLLSRNNASDLTQGTEHLSITRNIEQDYANKIIDILSPIVGQDNIRAQVSADIDFTLTETTAENFNPNTVSVRSEQIQEERSGSMPEDNVEAGTLSDTPPATDTDAAEQPTSLANVQTRVNSTRNFEVDRMVSHTKSVPGTINRLSVAVLVDLDGNSPATEEAGTNPLNEQERLGRLTQLVRDAIGYNEARGDSVNVIAEQFSPVTETFTASSIPIWEQSWIQSAGKQLIAGIVVIFLIFGVLRPALKSTVSPQSALPRRALGSPELALENDLDSDKVELSQASLERAAPPTSKYDQNLAVAQQLVQNEPVRAARMIKEWVASNE